MAEELQTKSENWNIAMGYVQMKLLKPLIEMDKLVTIAIYGTEQIEDAFRIPEEMKVEYRIQAIRRLIDTIKEIIENSEFACKKESKETLIVLDERVDNVSNVLSGITNQTTDQRTNQIVIRINEPHFHKCLNELRKIKKEIVKPLNDSALIFQSSDEINLETIKDQIIHGG